MKTLNTKILLLLRNKAMVEDQINTEKNERKERKERKKQKLKTREVKSSKSSFVWMCF